MRKNRSCYYFAKLFCCTALLLSSCSITSTDKPKSISSEPKAPSWAIETISENPYVYRISQEAMPTSFYFYTVIENCSPKLSPAKAVSTRQLLVGLSNIRVGQQLDLEIANQHFLRSQIQADLEQQHLQLVVYTAQSENCLSDYAFWWRESGQQVQDILANLDQFMQRQIG